MNIKPEENSALGKLRNQLYHNLFQNRSSIARIIPATTAFPLRRRAAAAKPTRALSSSK